MQLPNYDRIHTALCAGGATINPRTGEFVTSGGIVVAVPGHERIVKAVDLDATIQSYAALVPDGYLLGLWLDRQPRVYLDVVEVIADRPRALGLAAQRGEQAVYDLDTSETIYVNP